MVESSSEAAVFSFFRRLFGTSSPSTTPQSDPTELCDDCGAADGELHDLFCTRERCPFCGNQLAGCGCIHHVLKLTPEESRAVDEYEDDSLEPLQSIMERWKAALNVSGRVPFHGRKLDATVDDLLQMAARGQLDSVKKLLAAGVPVDAVNEVHYTALKAAARGMQVEIVRHLLSLGADVSHRDIYGHTALHCAVGSPSFREEAERQAECVRVLLEAGADPNTATQAEGTPLGSAAWFGCGPSVDLLLKAGADTKRRDDRGRTPADLARERGHEELAARLI
jgi:hypothetical protein